MSFLWPTMLVFLLAVPLLGGLYVRLQRRRQRALARYGSFGLVQSGVGRAPGFRRHLPPALFLASLTILILALARPQTVVSLPRIEGTVILSFDVSGSMAADDLQPTRMEAAKAAARAFVQRQPSTVQIGVVAFSEGGLSVQAPTNDQEAILSTINRLTPQRGTSIAQGILASLNALAAAEARGTENEGDPSAEPPPTMTPVPEGTYAPAVIVLLTDGENTAPPDPFEAAQTAADRGIRIYTVGIGSAAGTVLEVNGFTVHTRLDEPTLKQIALMTGGEYYNAENEEELRTIYENLDRHLVVRPEKMEITALLAGVGVLLLLIGGVCSLVWFGRVP